MNATQTDGTRIARKSSMGIPAIKIESPKVMISEPFLEPLIPAEPVFNERAYSCFLENMIASLSNA